MTINIPKLSLVVLVGTSGSGKSTFARKHFLETEVISSDFCRALVSDDENNLAVTRQAFELLHDIARKRLAWGRLTVVDATNVQREARKPLVQIAREFHCIPVAIVLNLPERLCQERNKERPDRNFGPHVIRKQRSELRRSLRGLKREGFRHVFVLNSEEEVDAATIERVPLWNDKAAELGPFDIIGDVHGCYDELETLLAALGYEKKKSSSEDSLWGDEYYAHPEGRKAVFLGDIVDRGPRVLDTMKLVRNMVQTENALCVPGNHDMKFKRALMGRNVQVTHGLEKSLDEIGALPEEIRPDTTSALMEFLDGLVSHYVLDGGKLVVAHAGMKEEMQGRGSGKVRDFALYGETTGETDEFGLPVRCNWAADYRGTAKVVYGHTPVPEAEWLNRTINIDTGCVFGGKLTALRYPESEIVSVPAARTYCEPAKPFLADSGLVSELTAQQTHDDILDAEDVIGKRIISTGLRGLVTIREENAIAALEVMSRFATDPKWIIYLPPTMSPCETTTVGDYLEAPAQAFAHYRSAGIPTVVCEEKHMGSRAVVIVCKDEDAVRRRFGIVDAGVGIVYTRTGRRFFDDIQVEDELLSRLCAAMNAADFWSEFATDWACLDCELMPWSAKAQELLRGQYAAVGAAAKAALAETIPLLEKTAARENLDREVILPEGSSAHPVDIDALVEKYRSRQDVAHKYVVAYRQYCWPVSSIEDIKLAPFHLLATEGKVHIDRDHVWHMEQLAKVCRNDETVLLATPYKVVNVTEPESEKAGIEWWEQLTGEGGEGMVVKPFKFVMRGKRGLVQPALKVRGREYLRIIYGPEYTSPEHLVRLRQRRLGTKRSLALREFALGVESLQRFVRKEPLRRVHECVFGTLALESEPVDPRL